MVMENSAVTYPAIPLNLRVNGVNKGALIDARTTLLEALRIPSNCRAPGKAATRVPAAHAL